MRKLGIIVVILTGIFLTVYKLKSPKKETAFDSGVSSMQAARFAEAEQRFSEAVRNNSQNSEVLYSMGWALQAQGKDTEALDYYKRAEIKAKQENNFALLERLSNNAAAIYVNQKNYWMAEKYFRTALKINPKSVDSNYQLGLVLMNQNKTVEARKYFDEALKIDSKYLAARDKIHRLEVAHEGARLLNAKRKPAAYNKKSTSRRS